MRAAIRGVSVVEVLIVAVLFFGLLSLVASFLVKGKRLAVRTESLSSVQQEAVKLTRALAQDLNRGTQIDMRWASGALVFLSSKAVDPTSEPELEFEAGTGRVVWKQWVGYYLDPASMEVRRFTQALASPSSDPFSITGGLLETDLPGLPSSQGRVVARQILDFVPTGRVAENLMEFRVRAQGQVPLGNLTDQEKIIEVELSTMIRMGTVVP
jgi:hypothetical protein